MEKENLDKITKKKQELDRLRPLPTQSAQNLAEWLKVELTYSSNAIEGSTLTRAETAEVIEKGIWAIIKGKSLKDQLEAMNHAKAIDFIKVLATQKKGPQSITEGDILAIHKFILSGIDDTWAGSYRKTEVFISGATVELPQPQKVSYLMAEFVQWLESQQEEHPVKVAADAHFKLVSIHPFVDGNGRTARLLMNLILLINSYPMAIIRNEDRTEYITAVNRGQMGGDLRAFYLIVSQAEERSLDAYIAAAQGKPALPYISKGLRYVVKSELLKIGEVASRANVPIPTVRYYVSQDLLKPQELSKGGFMLFNLESVGRIKEIKRLQREKRLSISEIKRKLS
jgi:Fic family protein